MNTDWSLSEAMKTINLQGTTTLMEIYDVVCQFGVNQLERIAGNHFLSKPETLELIQAIGLFHVHGHQDACLYRYATSYIQGVGIIDGEILETLWAPLNEIFKSMRTASLSHRTEVFDDHKGDSNWKKITNIGKLFL